MDPANGSGRGHDSSSNTKLELSGSSYELAAAEKKINELHKMQSSRSLQPAQKSAWKIVNLKFKSALAVQRDLSDLRTMIGRRNDPASPGAASIVNSSGKTIIYPETQFRNVWDALQVILLLYVATLVPYRFGLNQPVKPLSTAFWLEVHVDLYFVLDFILNWRMAYYDSKSHRVVDDPKQIARNYLHSWFLIDLVSILPIGYIQLIVHGTANKPDNGGGDTKILKVFRMLRLAKLLRLAKITRLIKQYSEEAMGLTGAFRLLSTLLLALCVSHFTTCFWYYVGNSPGGWVEFKFGREEDGCTTVAQYDAEGSPKPSYIQGGYVACDDSRTAIDKYSVTFWWSLTLLIGGNVLPDLRPATPWETVVLMFFQMVGSITFAIVIGTVGTLLMSQKVLEQKMDTRMAELREFLVEKRVPPILRKQIRQYMERM